jgi:hypothetical protein
VWLFAQIAPACFGHVDAIVFGGGFDVSKGLFSLVVGDVFDLIEASNGVADVRGVGEGFLAFVGEGVDEGGELIALLCVEGLVVFVMFPGCFHVGLQSCGKMVDLQASFYWMRFAAQML